MKATTGAESTGDVLGVIAAGHPGTVAAAEAALRAGGNAFDAAIAAGFAATVAEPTLTSLGGGGFLLAHVAGGTADIGSRDILFDFFVDAPGRGLDASALMPHFHPVTVHFPDADQDFNIGNASAAVPGNLKGFLHIHERLGCLSLSDVVEPAAILAESAVELNANQAYVIELLEPILTATPRSAALFAPGGRALRAGERFANPDAAAFMRGLPARADDFYEGALAGQIASDMRAGHGMITADDLDSYRVVERAPLLVDYGCYRVVTNPAPSFGGPLLALGLTLGRPDEGEEWGSGRYLRRLAESQIEIDRRRDSAIGGDAAAVFSRGTTHVSVSDASGNVASMTTSNGEASGYIVPGTGIALNNMMGEDDLHPDGFHGHTPGVRVASMMSPSFVLDGDSVSLIVGSGGSKRIRTTMQQVISSVLDFGHDVATAVQAPRIHWDGEACQVEPGFTRRALEDLSRSITVNEWSDLNMYFGGAHAVDPSGVAAGDPRRGGTGIVVVGD